MSELKRYDHTPPHLFTKNSKYFITARTYKGKSLFSSRTVKNYLFNSITEGFEKRKWNVEDWVILDNHYHLMVSVHNNPEILPDIINEIHKFSALWIKKNVEEASTLQKVWYNYWDKCINYERSYFSRINYIWKNPVNHGYVEDPSLWEFGSYYYRFKDDVEYLQKINKKYPCDKLLDDDKE